MAENGHTRDTGDRYTLAQIKIKHGTTQTEWEEQVRGTVEYGEAVQLMQRIDTAKVEIRTLEKQLGALGDAGNLARSDKALASLRRL